MELAKAAGARRGVPLPVSAPFHCALMEPAQQRLRADLDATEFAIWQCPLINNWQAREIRTGAEAREGLYQQVPNPVRWVESVDCWPRAASIAPSNPAPVRCWPGWCAPSLRPSP